jgi:hypothetical protein
MLFQRAQAVLPWNAARSAAEGDSQKKPQLRGRWGKGETRWGKFYNGFGLSLSDGAGKAAPNQADSK